MALWWVRHQLPLADRLGVAGTSRSAAREVRDDYEAAAQLADEIDRILVKLLEVGRAQGSTKHAGRARGHRARPTSRDARAEPFDEEAFHGAHERLVRRSTAVEPWRKSELREYVESIGVAVLVAVLLRALVVEAFKIPSGSMLPTLADRRSHLRQQVHLRAGHPPDRHASVFAHAAESRRRDRVREPGSWTERRTRGLHQARHRASWDILEADGGHPIINGWRVPSCLVGTYTFSEQKDGPTDSGELYVEYLGERAYLTFYEAGHFDRHEGPYVVQPGEVWVFGDNRNNSRDSRAWFGGKGGGAPFDSIKGRALFVWLPLDRFLVNVMGSPILPNGSPPDMVKGIATCLAKRPSLSESTPPAPHARPAP